MSQQPQFSVIIPTYNRRGYIVDAINSVLAQTYAPAEIIIVDDGSTDDTEAVVATISPKIRFVYKTNGGVSSARNHGIKLAQYEWLAFLDSDDTWEPKYLAAQTESILRYPGVLAHMTNARILREDGGVDGYFEHFNFSVIGSSSLIQRPLRHVIQNQLYNFQLTVVHKSIFEKTAPFDTALRLGEDLECMARISQLTPLAITQDKFANIIHRPGDKNNLSRAVTDNAIKTAELYHTIFSTMAKLPNLELSEKKALARLHSSNRRKLGNLLLRKGLSTDARRAFKQGFLLNPTTASFIKYVVSYTPFLAKLLDRRGRELKA